MSGRVHLRSLPADVEGLWLPAEEPFYLAVGREVELFEAAHRRQLAVMLKGPTGVGKTRFVEYMAWKLGRPLVTTTGHDDLSATDLTGRWLIRGGETVWQDGPLALAARHEAICYIDEVVEARQDLVVVLHPLTDHRRLLPIDKRGEIVRAGPGFQLVVSYNPGYQHALKELKPSTRQRFVTIDFGYPPPEVERTIVVREAGVDHGTAAALVRLAGRMRVLGARGISEVPGTRLLVDAARLMAEGVAPAEACSAAIIGPLTDDAETAAGLADLVRLAL